MGSTIPPPDIDVNWEQIYPVAEQPSTLDMEEPFTEENIWTTVFSLGADKASGLDGFNMQFYQHFWPMLHQDFIDTLQAFFDGHLKLSRFNRDYISFMPKISGARNIGDFKPISLINSIFKIISKFLALQLEKKIGDLIDPAQSAFIHGKIYSW